MRRPPRARIDDTLQASVLDGPGAPRTFRASDDDRRQATNDLQAHYVAGRLTSAELEDRLEQALAARTLADLDAVRVDLPAADRAPEEPARRGRSGRRAARASACAEGSFRAHATSYVLVMALLVTIWLLTTPGGYFWPVWPMLGWGIGLASHGLATRGLRTPRRALGL